MQNIESIADWEGLMEESMIRPVVIFKHSNACPESTTARQFLARSQPMEIITEPIHMVVVQEKRDVSDKIEQDLGVKHESPQVIVIKNKKAVYDVDHEAIDPVEIEKIICQK